MVDRQCIYLYKDIVNKLDAARHNLSGITPGIIASFQNISESFLNAYSEFFPSECRILRTYVMRALRNQYLSGDEIHLINYLINIIDEDFDKKVKQPKIFISHSQRDMQIVEKFVDLLSYIGLDNNCLFCSSIPGYNIKQEKGDIYEYIRNEFNNNLFVIFMLSDNYYNSKACLNEMGAAWVLQKKYQSILLPGFEFSQVQGAINPREISFKLDDKIYRNVALGELKNVMVEFLGIQDVDTSKWDYQRERFFAQIDTF